jgi:hypothetical protein
MELNDEEQEELTENTANVREALDKVRCTNPLYTELILTLMM